MTIRTTIIASTALLALAACGRNTEQTQVNADASPTELSNVGVVATTATAPVGAAQTFANVAAASDAFEIETSKLAVTNAASPTVKAYATKMIDAHTTSTAKLKTAAAGVSPAITPDATLNAEQQRKLDELKALNGAAFDRAYIAGQTAGHQQALDALKAYAATGDAPQLKTFASEMVPIVTAHLNMVKGLKA